MSEHSFLVVSRTSPYGNQHARDAFDTVLAGSIFGFTLSVLWMGDGVYQLLKHQPTTINRVDLQANLKALAMYDVDKLYVSSSCLKKRGLTADNLELTAEPVSEETISTLFQSHSTVLNFG